MDSEKVTTFLDFIPKKSNFDLNQNRLMVNRILRERIQSKLFKGKAILLMGARQIGKTTLLKSVFNAREDILWFNGDETDVQELFATASATRLKALFGAK